VRDSRGMIPAELADVGLYESMSRYGDLCIHAVIDLRRTFTREAIERASKTLRDLRIAEVVKLDVTIEDGGVARFRARLSVSFKYEGE